MAASSQTQRSSLPRVSWLVTGSLAGGLLLPFWTHGWKAGGAWVAEGMCFGFLAGAALDYLSRIHWRFTTRTILALMTALALLLGMATGNMVAFAAACWLMVFSLMGGWMSRRPPEVSKVEAVAAVHDGLASIERGKGESLEEVIQTLRDKRRISDSA